jgi:hypothetical protein
MSVAARENIAVLQEVFSLDGALIDESGLFPAQIFDGEAFHFVVETTLLATDSRIHQGDLARKSISTNNGARGKDAIHISLIGARQETQSHLECRIW